jgi:hypothetical protein
LKSEAAEDRKNIFALSIRKVFWCWVRTEKLKQNWTNGFVFGLVVQYGLNDKCEQVAANALLNESVAFRLQFEA